MRIALLHYTLPPVIGGVERVIRDQAKALHSLGHEVTTLTRTESINLGSFAAVIVHNVFTMPFDLAWTRELTALAAAADPSQRWINWVHDVAAVNPHYANIRWAEPVPQALHVAVSVARQQDYARATGLPAEAIQVIPNGLDFASVLALTPRIATLKFWHHDLVLAHPTRLIRRKNIELGLRTVACLKKAGIDVLYVISGAPDPHQTDGKIYHQELKQLSQDLGASDQVLFLGETGSLADGDVRSLYAAADALFFPSTGEGFGLPLLEALAHRLPVFCSDLPVHKEVLGPSGRYFNAQDKPEAISAQIMQWMKTDPNIQHRRHLWRDHEMVKICQEHLEPLLLTATAIPIP